MVLSAKFEKAATLALIRKSFDVILAFFFQMLFFQVLHNILYTFQNAFSTFSNYSLHT